MLAKVVALSALPGLFSWQVEAGPVLGANADVERRNMGGVLSGARKFGKPDLPLPAHQNRAKTVREPKARFVAGSDRGFK